MKQIIKCGRVFTAVDESVRENMAVAVEDGKITAVVPMQEADLAGAEVIDLSDKFVMPGLIDAHVHVNLSGEPSILHLFADGSEGALTITSIKNAQKDLMAGFTSIRDECGFRFTDVAVRDAIQKGLIAGPRMLVSGEALTGTGGHADSHLAPYVTGDTALGAVINGPDQARKAARRSFKYGADQLKIMATGGVMSMGDDPKCSELSFEEMKAIIEVAKARGRITSAHAHAGDGIKLAVRAGVTVIEHATMADEEAREMMRQAGTWVVPTLSPGVSILRYGPEAGLPDWLVEKDREVVQTHASNVKKFFEMGIPLAFGTDCGTSFNYHGKQAYEFQLLHQAGIPAAETLAMATINAAKMMRMDDKVGSVEAGKLADIVAVDADPIADLSVMMHVSFVMKDGKIYKQ